MSQLRVDEITDEQGAGKPGFPNGINATNGGLSNKSEFGVLATNRFEGIGDSTSIIEFGTNGEVLMPNQPAFRAMSDEEGGTKTVVNDEPIQYNLITLDVGNNYDNTNYRFIAPIAGIYYICANLAYNIQGNSPEKRRQIQIYKNGSRYEYMDFAPNDDWDTATISSLVDLEVNDFVYIAVDSTESSGENYWNGSGSDGVGSFTGYLIG